MENIFAVKQIKENKKLNNLEFVLDENGFELSENLARYFLSKNYKMTIQITSYIDTYKSIVAKDLNVSISDLNDFVDKVNKIIFPNGVPTLLKYSFGAIK